MARTSRLRAGGPIAPSTAEYRTGRRGLIPSVAGRRGRSTGHGTRVRGCTTSRSTQRRPRDGQLGPVPRFRRDPRRHRRAAGRGRRRSGPAGRARPPQGEARRRARPHQRPADRVPRRAPRPLPLRRGRPARDRAPHRRPALPLPARRTIPPCGRHRAPEGDRLRAHPGLLVEDKGCSVALHWRLAPHDADFAARDRCRRWRRRSAPTTASSSARRSPRSCRRPPARARSSTLPRSSRPIAAAGRSSSATTSRTRTASRPSTPAAAWSIRVGAGATARACGSGRPPP